MTDSSSENFQVCINCDRVIASLRCGQCKFAWYCSKQCQIQHWKNGHRQQCKKISTEKKEAENVNYDDVQKQVRKEQEEHTKKINEKRVESSLDDMKPISEQFPDGEYPCGELHAYNDYKRIRFSQEEARERERSKNFERQLRNARKGAEAHRQARAWLQREAKPGKKLIDLCEGLEARVRTLTEANFPYSGTAFTTGCSVNECAAHFSPNPGDTKELHQDDVVKFDFGTHFEGQIIDSAWTMCFNDKFNPLVEAVREATNEGIRMAGIDVRLYDIGASIQEVMESHEVELDGKTYPVKCIENLNGHNISPYKIHHTKTVPIVKRPVEMNLRMEENEFFAIETFGSINGRGFVTEGKDNSHYMINYQKKEHFPRNAAARKLYKQIQKNFGTLCFCPRYMDRLGMTNYQKGLDYLMRDDILHPYPPLFDVKGSYTAQFEHTICLRPTCKEILTKGPDY